MTLVKGLKGKESRMRLLTIAADEFANRGFHETKVSTIVTRAGLTQPAFYLYFSNKEAIFDEIVNEFRTRLRMLVQTSRFTPTVEAHDVPKQLLMTLETIFRFLAATPNSTRIGLFLAPKSDQIKEELTSLLIDNLRAEQQMGHFRSELAMETVAECIVGIVERLTLSLLLPGIKGPESLALQVVNLLLYGMLANGDTTIQDS
ncbi:TetR/AcrR family transcriptional regulator [Brevibacillus choshinensis]|uniref:TetR/AcrR family transcriptional regulator n=1 Tax=Brevibacillus choshinensis TaxID=54911 RepID=UPI002E1DB41E|nr:TetR/AcrR family transcriptional regulator [Brevibacillus choshinensis]MED4754972.1 TetR/AcrR family transcriptional regulator [Brevibacillus choshinensis]MED4783652.1 TetR/AcrR family transcriptional regulator [Brevibacillus choshinensis]